MGTGKETILYYNPVNADKILLFRSIFGGMGIRIKSIDPAQTIQKVGYLAGVEGFVKQPADRRNKPSLPPIGEEMMVLCGFEEGRLEEVLSLLRHAGPSVALKAVMTENNCGWSFAQLYEELRAEHAAMAALDTRAGK